MAAPVCGSVRRRSPAEALELHKSPHVLVLSSQARVAGRCGVALLISERPDPGTTGLTARTTASRTTLSLTECFPPPTATRARRDESGSRPVRRRRYYVALALPPQSFQTLLAGREYEVQRISVAKRLRQPARDGSRAASALASQAPLDARP